MKASVLRILLATAILLAARAHAAAAPDAIRLFFSDAFEERLRDNPEFATNVGRHDYDDRWRDWSKDGRASVHHHLEARLKQLAGLPTDAVSEADRLSMRLFRYQAESDLAAEDLETHLLSLQQLYGFHVRVYITIDRMTAHSVREYENILAR